MALLDLVDLLFDPDFSQPWGAVKLIRAVETVSDDGLAVYTRAKPVVLNCVVNPVSIDQSLLPDLANIQARIEVYTIERLNTLTDGKPADIIEWEGKYYTVMNVRDYTRFGAGFTVGTCEQVNLQSADLGERPT